MVAVGPLVGEVKLPPTVVQSRVKLGPVGLAALPTDPAGVLQLISPSVPAWATGARMSCGTVTFCVSVQPLAELIISRVYTPGKLTVGCSVPCPLMMPGPDQV